MSCGTPDRVFPGDTAADKHAWPLVSCDPPFPLFPSVTTLEERTRTVNQLKCEKLVERAVTKLRYPTVGNRRSLVVAHSDSSDLEVNG